MPQTVLTLIGELQPTRAEAARSLIEDLRKAVEAEGRKEGDKRGVSHAYEPLVARLPGLHFASIMVFDDERYDPMLSVELNFDGPVEDFLPRLETPMLLPHLRAILRCCKPPPAGKTLPLYQAATCDGHMNPYLTTLIVRPAVAHQGNRGLDRDRILREADLYDTVQKSLGEGDFCRARDAVALHAALRSVIVKKHGWLDETAADRIASSERALDWAKLLLLLLLVLVTLLAPGLLLALGAPSLGRWLVGIVIAAAVATAVAAGIKFLRRKKPASKPPRPTELPPTPAMWKANEALRILVPAGLTFLAALLLVGIFWLPLGAGFAGLLVLVASIGVALRRLERGDLVHEKPRIAPKRLREIMELEDHISQNHMGSVVHVKPGVLRAVLIRLGLLGLGLLLRVAAADGYLAQMRTIHFAHWALLDNGSRLIFYSNFDSSWESYLDDFIEKAHPGLTLAWSNGIGFPRTKFLVEDGATHGPLFKSWARHSMARGLFWVSAYPNLSVNQIERNCAIAAGLCARTLSPRAAETWSALL